MNTLQEFSFVRSIESHVLYRPETLLDRCRWWLVRKLGGNCPYDSVHVERLSIDAHDFMGRLYKQKQYLFRHFNRDTKLLLIGGEDYEKLMQSNTFNEMVRFDAQFNYGRKILGMEVIIVPWMRGILVMP